MTIKGWGITITLMILALLFSLMALASLSPKQLPSSFGSDNKEVSSPGNWIQPDQILVYQNRIILNIPDATWAEFTDTNSMDPLIDKDTNALEILPRGPEYINVGDIISYRTAYGTIIHRVIEKNQDEKGIYYVVKGDNNTSADPAKVRFEDVKGVVVAFIY